MNTAPSPIPLVDMTNHDPESARSRGLRKGKRVSKQIVGGLCYPRPHFVWRAGRAVLQHPVRAGEEVGGPRPTPGNLAG